MQIANCNGDFECSSWEELEKLIRKSAGKTLDDIWLSGDEEEYPCLAILINGKDACVHYFYDEEGDMWQSVGYGNRDVEFVTNGEKSNMPADAVISLEQALACARQFYDTLDRPDCVEWREL